MPKLSHCGRFLVTRSFYMLPSEAQWEDAFQHQVLLIALCTCGKELRGWYGIRYDGAEDLDLHNIRPRRFKFWDDRVSGRDPRKPGALYVKAQSHWDGKYSNDYRWIRVS